MVVVVGEAEMKTPFAVVISREPLAIVNGANWLDIALIELVREASDPWEFTVLVKLLIDACWEVTVLDRVPTEPCVFRELVKELIEACCEEA